MPGTRRAARSKKHQYSKQKIMNMTAFHNNVNKHERLTKQWQGDNEQLKFKMTIFEECGHKETKHYQTFQEQIKWNELHIKHSGYMIRLFKSFIDNMPGNPDAVVKIQKVIHKLMLPNAQEIDESMSKLVELDHFTEEFYKTHMEGFMREINSWDR